MSDMLKTHGLDKMQNERLELALQNSLQKAQQGDYQAYLLATLVQSNVLLVDRLKQLEARLDKMEGRGNGR
ncbi:hypothetical protein ACFQH5_11225 [Halomonas salifodinae]|uniref:Uncharacterized protein n=1 Tax=Halomonas salifodinae TaxID=438745 RepID=A0ABW2F123_9GAMM